MNTLRESPSFFLFAHPSVLGGVASLFDFANSLSLYNVSLTPEQADFLATKADWLAVGDDLRAALRELELSVASGQEED